MTGPAAGEGAKAFGNRELLAYLAEVDAELPVGAYVEIAAIGGAAISFRRPSRLSDDVDVVSEGMPQELRDAAAAVAARRGLRSDWINDAARLSLPRLDPQLETVYRGDRLTLHIAGPRYLLATKLLAGRDVDMDDAVHLAIDAGVTTAEAMLDLLAEAYPAPLLTPRTQYIADQVAAAVAAQLNLGVDL